MRRQVCVVSPFVPSATIDHAGGAYLHRLIQEWHSQSWAVTLLSPRNEVNERYAASLDSVAVSFFPSGFEASRWRKAGRLLASGDITGSPAAWFKALDPEARRALRAADVIDLQWGEAYRLASFLRRRFPQAMIVATAHDVVSQAAGRAALSAKRWQDRALGRLTAWHFQRSERPAFNACDRIYVFNPGNAELIAARGVSAPVLNAPPLTESSPDAACPDPGSRRALFTGAMWRPENQEGIRWFLDQVWPTVVESVPDGKLRIAGSRPPEWLIERQGPSVEVTGFIADLNSSYQDVAVVVAPLLRGAGLKFKVAQALVMGYPIVATSVGLEGINESTRPNLLTAQDNPTDFARALIAELTDSVPMSAADRALVRESFDFDTKLAAMVAEIIASVDG